MAKTRVGINGFGRIGRNFFRARLERGGEFEIVAINDLGDAKTMGHLLKYDSVLGQLDEDVEVGDGVIKAGKHELKVLSEKDPAALPWGELDIDLVIESTGFFTDREGAQKHIDAQMSLEEKRRLADYVIENNGSLEDLQRQTKAVLEKIKAT